MTRRLLIATVALAAGLTTPAAIGAQRESAADILRCGSDRTLPAAIPVTWWNVVLAGDSRLFSPCPLRTSAGTVSDTPHPGSHREVREATLLAAAATATTADVRWRASQALGRVADPDAVGAAGDGLLPRLLDDADAVVRREAANAIGTALAGSHGDMNARFAARLTPAHVVSGRRALETRLATEQDDEVAAAILETLGRLNYADDGARAEIETVLVGRLTGSAARVVGAAKGMEALVRRRPMRAIDAATRTKLREVATDATAPDRARRLAMASLGAARDDDAATLTKAAADADWQVRRLAAARIDLTRADHVEAGARLLADADFHVRYDLLLPLSRQVGRTRDCAPLVKFFEDPAPIVAMRAMDLVPAACADLAPATRALEGIADKLGSAGPDNWHLPARALAALARVAPAEARPRLSTAATHAVWQVRASAAGIGATLEVEPPVFRLTDDRVPNVRTAALEALNRMRSPQVTTAAIKALTSADHQLVRTAATLLRGGPEARRAEINAALLLALKRLTEIGSDTSRDPRVAIVERLNELLPADGRAVLAPFANDWDPRVRATVTQQTSNPATTSPRHRYPDQPPATAVRQYPRTAIITMADGGRIELELMGDQAPVTVARFVQRASVKLYDGLTFHRVAPNFVVQGGSPGANEYSGASRYWRDEIGLASNLRGTVGLSTRGRDTGDGQFYFNLIDSPRLDHDYTVFARVRSGMDVVDRLLEGARIATVVLVR